MTVRNFASVAFLDVTNVVGNLVMCKALLIDLLRYNPMHSVRRVVQ